MADVIAQSHGGDGGGCDPPRGPADIPADCERALPSKRGRHKGLNTREKREQLGRPLPLEWDVRGRTYKEIGEYSSNFSRELGLLVRQYTDPDCPQWSKVPNASKERILAHLEDDLFDIGRTRYGEGHMPGILRGIDTSCAKKYSDWKYDIKEHLTINGPQNRYGGCTDTQWQKAIDFFRRPEITKRSAVNKENRKKLKELSYGGSQSIPTLCYKKRNLETGQLESIPDSWMDTHHKSGTGWVTETAKNTWEELRAYRDTQQTQATDTESSTPVSSAPEDEDISLVQNVFGKRRGHQKGYGRILNIRDRTPFDFRPSQTRDEELSEMRERLRQLEEHVRTHCITPGSQSAPPPPPDDPDVGAPTQ